MRLITVPDLEEAIENAQSRLDKMPDGSKERAEQFRYLRTLKDNYHAITGERWETKYEEARV